MVYTLSGDPFWIQCANAVSLRRCCGANDRSDLGSNPNRDDRTLLVDTHSATDLDTNALANTVPDPDPDAIVQNQPAE